MESQDVEGDIYTHTHMKKETTGEINFCLNKS